MADEVGSLDLEPVENARDVAALRFLVVAVCGVRREAHSAQVRNDDRVTDDVAPPHPVDHLVDRHPAAYLFVG